MAELFDEIKINSMTLKNRIRRPCFYVTTPDPRAGPDQTMEGRGPEKGKMHILQSMFPGCKEP